MPAVKPLRYATLLALLTSLTCPAIQAIDQLLLSKVATRYGTQARQRFEQWQTILAQAKTLPDEQKLTIVNDFFNRKIKFVSDRSLWQTDDYWATPSELLALGAGDCEDFSIAKYFTLLALGVPDAKMRITYVKAMTLNQAHMVLTYFSAPQATPLVLDNIDPTIASASQRRDLQPVYSFNGTGLWLAKNRGQGKLIGSADRLNPWADLQQRMLDKLL